MKTAPVLIERDDAPEVGPSAAPPVPDAGPLPEGRAMRTAAVLASRRGSALGRWFWRSLGALAGFLFSLWAWNFVTSLLARNTLLGSVALGLLGLFLLVCLALALREWAAFARLGRLDRLQREADAARAAGDLAAAGRLVAHLQALYSDRPDLAWGRDRLKDRAPEQFDAPALIDLAERELMAPLDQAARDEVEASARQVALVTAFVPLALADVAVALLANLRMIRRIAEIYGGRSGLFGSWRLVRTVMTHLVATGAVAAGDDLIHSVAGGGLLAKLSRRFGEGVINGALTARVGVAAIEVCRPLPFAALPRPAVSALVTRALAGLFGRDRDSGDGDSDGQNSGRPAP